MFSDPDAYELVMGRWSIRLAPWFMALARVEEGARVLDVGCGTGSLIQALAAKAQPSAIVGIDPVPAFVEHCRRRFPDPRVTFDCANALALPYPSGSFDGTLCLLVLMFIAEPWKAVSEMRRVTRAGGTVAACAWDREGLKMTALLWEAVECLDPAVRARRPPSLVGHEGQLGALWRAAGLEQVEESSLVIRMRFRSFNDYWLPLRGGTPYLANLDPGNRDRVRRLLRKRVLPGADRPFSLDAKALAVRGVVPETPL